MAKNIQVNLTFTADTTAAKQQMAQLQQQLSNLAATPIAATPGTKMAQSLQEATMKAVELKVALNNATNVNTGKLNFSKFSQELKRNKTSLQEYAIQLKKLGPEGVQAFSQLANSIRQAETPLISLQGKAAALGQTLANTARWMISSSMLQGLMSAFTGTIDYAKELNESLTNIRIVTGKSTEDMSRFAKEANKAAKALGATTTEYTDASLIYYQQGLSDTQVKERAETTLKLAKTVGEEASTVSEWMTAIWNNFDDGSQTLEYYADVLAKLGAATASSADEIAGGLEKFAAVSETVGLSYEYAASALATITAETRQSEDVVGTSLKTIFARIENLKLGDTLEDGTTLGQYSEALSKVGVHIQDANGNLRNMDNILDDIGARWDTLNNSEQVALAQSVAGIRQYNQFMALMSNWDVMEENVEMAKEANGELEHQHNIWETGIEGATNRVQANLEEIKNTLLDENDLIPLLNIADGFLTVVGDLVDSLGGLPGLLSIIASIGLKIYGPQAASMLMNMTDGIRSLYGGLTGKTEANKAKMADESARLTKEIVDASSSGDQEAAAMTQKFTAEQDATAWEQKNVNNINESYKQQLELQRQLVQLKGDAAIKVGQEADAAQKALDIKRNQIDEKYGVGTTEAIESAMSFEKSINAFTSTNHQKAETLDQDMGGFIEKAKQTGASDKELKQLTDQKSRVDAAFDEKKRVKELQNLNKAKQAGQEIDAKSEVAIKKLEKEYGSLNKAYKSVSKNLDTQKQKFGQLSKSMAGVNKVIEQNAGTNEEAKKEMEDFAKQSKNVDEKLENSKKANEEFSESIEGLKEKQDEALDSGTDWANSFVNTMQGVASAVSGLRMITGAIDSLSTAMAEGTVSFSDYLSAMVSILFGAGQLVTAYDSIKKSSLGSILITKLKAAAEKKAADDSVKNAAKVVRAEKSTHASKIKTILLEIGKWIAKGPIGWIVAAASAAALVGLIGMAFAVPKKAAANREEEQSTDIEAGKKAIEVGEGWQEQSNSMDDLIENYKRLQAVNNGTVEAENKILEAQQAIIDQIPALIDEYDKLKETYTDLGLEEGIKELEGLKSLYDKADAAGKADLMEDIETLTDEVDKKVNEKLADDSQKGVTAAAQKTLDAIGKQTGDKTYSGSTTWHVGDFNNSYAAKELADRLGTSYDSALFGGAGVDIELDASDPAKFIEQYETLQKFVNDMREEGKADDTVREVAEGLDAAKESYEELKELYGGSQDFVLSDFMEEQGIKPETINSYEEFLEVKEKFIAAAEKSGKATKEEAEEFFNAQKTLSSYKAVEEQATAIGEKYGKAVEKRIKNYAKELASEEDLTTFLKIDFNRFQTKEAFDIQMAYLKEQAEAEENKVEFKATFKAFESLKSGMGAEDYEKLQESLKWGEDGLKKFSDFLSMEFTAQQKYLADLTIENAEATLTELYEGLAVLENGLDKVSGKEKEALEDQIELQKIQIELLKIEQREAEETAEKVARERRKMIKDLKEEIDLYYKLNNLQRKAENLSDKISKAKDNAYGAKRIALMKLENEALETEIRLNDRIIDQAKEEQKWRKQELLKTNSNVKFDQYGNIDNYTEIQMGYITQLDALIDAGKEKTDEYTKLREEYDDFLDLASKYEGTVEKIEETTEDSAEKQRQILENNLAEIEYTVEIKLEVNERQLSALERRLSRLNDDAYDGAKKIILLQEQADKQLDNIELNKEGIRKTLQAAGVSDEDIARYMSGDTAGIAEKYGLDDQAIIDQLTAFTDGAIEAEEALYEINEQVKEQFSTSFDAWLEKLSEVGDQISKQSTILSNYKNIIDTVGQERLGITNEDMREIEEMQNKAVQNQVKNAKAQMDLTKSTLETVRKKMAESDPDSEAYKYWQEQERILSKQLDEDTANFTSSWQEAIETAYDTFNAASARMVKEFDDAIAGANFNSMEELEEYFNRQQEIEDRYLETYKQSYELSKLNRQLNQQLDKTDNVKSAKVLRNLQKEIEDIQKSGKQMSEYELNVLQKKYDLKLAEIALENAQNAKSTVRLRRDSEGNFDYVYTANQVEIDKAQQDYEDKLYALQELNDSYLEELQAKVISNRKLMSEELAALNRADFESDEEYWKAVKKITEKYTDNEAYLIGEVNKVIQSNQEVRATDLANYGSFTNDYGIKSGEWVTNFGQTTLGMATGFDTIEGYHQDLIIKVGDANTGQGFLGDLDGAYDDFEKNLKQTFYEAGVDLEEYGKKNGTELGTGSLAQQAFTSFKDHINTALFGQDGVSQDLDNLAQETVKLRDGANEALNGEGGLADKVQEFFDKYHPKMDAATTAAKKLDEALTNLKGDYTINVSAPGADEIDTLTTALNNLKDAIEALKSKTIKIETINKTTDGNSGETEEDTYTAELEVENQSGNTQAFDTKYYQGKRTNDAGVQQVYLTDDAKGMKNGSWYDISFTDTTWETAKNARGAYAVHMADYGGKISEIKTIGKRDYVKVDDGKWYSQGTVPETDWKEMKSNKYLSKTLKSQLLSYSQKEIDSLLDAYNTLTSASGVEIAANCTAWSNFSQKEGGIYGTHTDCRAGEFGMYHPDIDEVQDVAYNKRALMYNGGTAPANTLYAKVKVSDVGDTGLKTDNVYWVPINGVLNKSWSIEYYSFDTGGYTGSWGPEGRLAMLHQKEIVLNAHDTENLLTAVSMIREISDKLESNALAMRYLNGISDFKTILNNTGDTLQQEVHITAEFPNATDHNEIEEAFGNLVNLASQYANRK